MAFQKGHTGYKKGQSTARQEDQQGDVQGNVMVAGAAINEYVNEIETPKVAGKIEIRLKDPKRVSIIKIRSILDPQTGKLIPLVGRNGETDAVFPITKGRVFLDPADAFDKQVLAIMAKHPYKHVWTVHDKEQEADVQITFIETEDEARGIIRNLNSVQLVDFARVLGFFTDNTSEKVLKTKLYEMASDISRDHDGRTGAQRIISEFEAPDRELKELLWRARHRNVLRVKNGVWYYGGQPMGENMDKVVLWLHQNEDLIPIIQRDSDLAK